MRRPNRHGLPGTPFAAPVAQDAAARRIRRADRHGPCRPVANAGKSANRNPIGRLRLLRSGFLQHRRAHGSRAIAGAVAYTEGALPCPLLLRPSAGTSRSFTLQFPIFQDVLAAQERIRPYLGPDAVLFVSGNERAFGHDGFIKHENYQPVGAFKVRGGVNLVSQLSADERGAD